MESIVNHKILFIIAIICILGTASLVIFDSLKPAPTANTSIAYVEETTTSTTTTTTSTTTVPTTKAITTTVKNSTKAQTRR